MDEDYVGLLEVRCRFFRTQDYVPARGGRAIYVPCAGNWDERIFFKLVVPDFDAPQAQLTGSRIHIAKVWDDKIKTMDDFADPTGFATCLDSQMSNHPDDIVKACVDFSKPKDAEDRFLSHGKRNYIIGFPRPIIGIYARLDSRDVYEMLKKFDSHGSRGSFHSMDFFRRMHIGENEQHDAYIPVENILGYETPKRFLEKRDGFTGDMLIDWPPSVAYADSITGMSLK